MMEALAPMLAVPAREPFDSADYLFEVKWDGIRALSCCDEGGWRLWGREGADYRRRYPELAVLAALPAGTMPWPGPCKQWFARQSRKPCKPC